ncbi:HNH endonuclease [Kitasatospora sp. NPDC098663]
MLIAIDDSTPLALGGEDMDSNAWPLCRTCHQGKSL